MQRGFQTLIPKSNSIRSSKPHRQYINRIRGRGAGEAIDRSKAMAAAGEDKPCCRGSYILESFKKKSQSEWKIYDIYYDYKGVDVWRGWSWNVR